MGWIVAGPFLALLYVINKRVNPKGKAKKAVAIITMAVAAAAGCGLAYTFLGSWTATIVGWISSAVSGLSNASELKWVIPLCLAIIAVGVAAADIACDKKADKGAQAAAIMFPVLLALVIAGSMGHRGGNAVHQATKQLQAQITKLGGSGAKGGGR